MKKFVGFLDYLKSIYLNKPDNLKEIYGSFENFSKNALKTGLYREWIEEIKDKSLSENEMNQIAQDMKEYGKVSVEKIHTGLAMICHQQNIELPPVGGCLTPEYWKDFFKE